MPLYVTLSEGPRADQARPILVTSQQRVVAALLREIGRLGNAEGSRGPRRQPAAGSRAVKSDGHLEAADEQSQLSLEVGR